MVTPVPWKLMDDVSIWSQNWPWIPQPTRGPIEVKQSACTLCPHGCAMRVRMAGGFAVGVAGVATNRVTRGALCPLGFGAHQLNWHPERLRVVKHRGNSSSWGEARQAFTKAASEGPVVVIDGYPGRAVSQVLESFAESRRAQYRVVVGPETRSLASYEKWSRVPALSLGYDLENAHTIVSFGAPLLDGWGTPGRFTRRWAEQAAGMADPQLRLIQVGPEISRTSARAWKWIPVHPHGEAALAAGLARVLLEEHLVPARGPMPAITLADASVQSGVSPDAIRGLARTIIARPPVLAIANDDDPAIAALNIVLGAVGARGGIVRRSKAAKSYASADAVVSSARAVLIDASVPWDFVPQTDAEVFRFAAWDGGSGKWLLPAPGFLEDLTDVPAAPASAIETYAIAPGLVKAPHETASAAQFLASVDPTLPTAEKIIHGRCEALFRARAGSLVAKETIPAAKIASPQKLEEELRNGAIWIGDPLRQEGFRCQLKEWPAAVSSRPPQTWSAAWPTVVLPPLASKLYRESSLRDEPLGRNA